MQFSTIAIIPKTAAWHPTNADIDWELGALARGVVANGTPEAVWMRLGQPPALQRRVNPGLATAMLGTTRTLRNDGTRISV